MNKKADLSMNMIILAAISLLVLAIIAYLIFGASSDINKGKGCEGLGGSCNFNGAMDCSDPYPIPNPASKCTDGGFCCMPAGLGDNN